MRKYTSINIYTAAKIHFLNSSKKKAKKESEERKKERKEKKLFFCAGVSI